MGFQRRIHLGHRHYTGQRGDIVVPKNTRTKEQNKQHAKCEHACPSCRWTTRQFPKSSMSQTRHTRADHATLAPTKNGERRTQSSRCRKQQRSWTHVQISKVGSEMVHEDAKRPSSSSVARRIPNILLSRGITHQDKTAKVHSARASLLKHREEDTTDDPVHAYEIRRNDNQHKVSMCPRTFTARDFPLPVLGGHSRKNATVLHKGVNTPNWHNL